MESFFARLKVERPLVPFSQAQPTLSSVAFGAGSDSELNLQRREIPRAGLQFMGNGRLCSVNSVTKNLVLNHLSSN
jgi:hypothetical protein